MEEEILLSEISEHITIESWKNYSSLQDKEKIKDMRGLNSFLDHSLKYGMFEFTPVYKNIKSKYFHNYKNESEYVILTHVPGTPSSFKTEKERHLKKHYGNPFSSISIDRLERVIKRKGNKITLKTYSKTRRREVNVKYFKKYFSSLIITIDISTGNFTIIKYDVGPKITQKKFYSNSFISLSSALSEVMGFFIFSEKSNACEHIFDTDKAISIVTELFGFREFNVESFLVQKTNIKVINNWFLSEMRKFFINKKKIKTPDFNYERIIDCYYPTEKFLKKNDRKLIASVLDKLGMKSKFTIKLFHEHPHIDYFTFARLCRIFGKDFPKYIGNISNIEKLESEQGLTYGMLSKGEQTRILNENFVILESEKENILQIFNDINFKGNRFFTLIHELYDHFSMIRKLRTIDPTFKLMARNASDFRDEHQQYSKYIQIMNKKFSIEYIFSDQLIKEVEDPMTIGKITLYPYILKNKDDYNEEGDFMHHCVAGYVNQDTSVIVSLRNENKLERITSEFSVHSGDCRQSQYYCNTPPPEKYVPFIELLKERIKKCHKSKILKSIGVKKVPAKINGIEVTTEEIINQIMEREVEDDFAYPEFQF